MFNKGLDKIIKQNSDKLKFNRKGITSGLSQSSWLDNYRTGGGTGPYANFPSTGMLTRNLRGPEVPTMAEGGPGEEEPKISAPASAFNYQDYYNRANKYLSRPIFKGTGLTAKHIADAAQNFYNTNNYVYPLDLLLTQGQMETKLGKQLKSKHNYFNVGNTDAGAVRNYASPSESVYDYMNLMYNDYLNKGAKSPDALLKPKGFVNSQGNRYASASDYEQRLAAQRAYIQKNYMREYGGDISLPNVYPNQMTPRFDYGGSLPKYQSQGEVDASVSGARDCGKDCHGNSKDALNNYTRFERKEMRALDKQVEKENAEAAKAIAKQKAEEWANYTNINLDPYDTKYSRKDNTFSDNYNRFIGANPNFVNEQSTLGLSPQQRYAMIYKMAGRSSSPTFAAPQRLRTYMNLPQVDASGRGTKFTDQQLYEAIQRMGGIDKYADWWKGDWSEIKKHGGIIKDDRGQWAHPGENTRISSDRITMQGVPYPVYGVANTGETRMMYPEQEYNFSGADYVDEYPVKKNSWLDGYRDGGPLLKYQTLGEVKNQPYVNFFSQNPMANFKDAAEGKKVYIDGQWTPSGSSEVTVVSPSGNPTLSAETQQYLSKLDPKQRKEWLAKNKSLKGKWEKRQEELKKQKEEGLKKLQESQKEWESKNKASLYNTAQQPIVDQIDNGVNTRGRQLANQMQMEQVKSYNNARQNYIDKQVRSGKMSSEAAAWVFDQTRGDAALSDYERNKKYQKLAEEGNIPSVRASTQQEIDRAQHEKDMEEWRKTGLGANFYRTEYEKKEAWKKEDEEHDKELKETQDANAAINSGGRFKFPDGSIKSWDQMSRREKWYVHGKANRKNFNLFPNATSDNYIQTAVDAWNPFTILPKWYGQGAEAPYVSWKTDSWSPYAYAVADPAITIGATALGNPELSVGEVLTKKMLNPLNPVEKAKKFFVAAEERKMADWALKKMEKDLYKDAGKTIKETVKPEKVRLAQTKTPKRTGYKTGGELVDNRKIKNWTDKYK